MLTNQQCMLNAQRAGLAIPAFNIPYLPMMEPVVRALRDTASFGFVTVARLEWVKFQAQSLNAVHLEYERVKDCRFTRLHLDHVPVIDEDNLRVDYESVIREAIDLGYSSVMVDGSRLPLDDNIRATGSIVEIAHAAGVAVEGELGAVLGHEAGPIPLYEELYASGRGFTDPQEAKWFVQETGVDWLSVAVGNIHGAISDALRHYKKPEAKLNIGHLQRICEAVGIPLVLHGGTGIQKAYVLKATKHGITKVNIATAIRQAYEKALKDSVAAGQEAAYVATVKVVTEDLEVAGSQPLINPDVTTR